MNKNLSEWEIHQAFLKMGKTIQNPYSGQAASAFEAGYLARQSSIQSQIDQAVVKTLNDVSEIATSIYWSADHAPCFASLLGEDEEQCHCPVCQMKDFKKRFEVLKSASIPQQEK